MICLHLAYWNCFSQQHREKSLSLAIRNCIILWYCDFLTRLENVHLENRKIDRISQVTIRYLNLDVYSKHTFLLFSFLPISTKISLAIFVLWGQTEKVNLVLLTNDCSFCRENNYHDTQFLCVIAWFFENFKVVSLMLAKKFVRK